MRALLAVLVLVAAVAAEEKPVVVEGAVKTDVDVPIMFDEMRLVSLYGLPKIQSEFGIRDIYNRPMFLAVRMKDKNDVAVFLLNEGLKSMYIDPKFDILRRFILSGPEKVAMMLNAAHALDLPEMRFNIHDIKLGSDSTPVTTLRLLREPMFPFVFLTPKTELPIGSLEKLFELGQFEVHQDKVMILKDLLPVEEITRPQTMLPYTRYLREPVTTIIESPIFVQEDPILSRHQVTGRLGTAYRPQTLRIPNLERLEHLGRFEQEPIYRQPYPLRTMFTHYPSPLARLE